MRRKTYIAALVLVLVLFDGVRFAVADDVNDQWVIRSDTPPEPMSINSVMCRPIPIPGKPGEYLFVPDEVNAFASSMASRPDVANGSYFSISVAGRQWDIRKTGTSFTIQLATPRWVNLNQTNPPSPGQAEGAPDLANAKAGSDVASWLCFGAALLLIAVVASIVWGVSRSRANAEAQASAYRLAQKRAAELDAERESERDKLLKQQQILQEREDAVRRQQEELESERRDQEQRTLRVQSSVENANEIMKRVPKRQGMKALARYLKESYLFDQAVEEWISVVRIINPDLNGNVEFRWRVPEDTPRSASVQVYRGERLVKTDSGLEGELKDHITPGRRASYRFAVMDRGRCRSAAVMEVKIPSYEEWSREATGPEDDTRERYRKQLDKRLVLEELRTDAIKDVNAKDVSEELKDWMLGVVDSVTAEFQEEG